MLRFYDYGYGRFDATKPVGPATWPRFDLLWVHDGCVQLTLMHKHTITLDAGSGVLIYPHTHFAGHAVSKVSRASVQHFAIKPQATLQPFSRLRRKRRGFEQYQWRHNDDLERDIDRAISLAFVKQSTSVHDMRVALMAIMLGQLANRVVTDTPTQARSDTFDALIEWLDAHPDKSPDLNNMAQRVGLSVSHFRALFGQRFGVSPGQYVLHARMAIAARLLRETPMPIKAVARHVGSTDLPNFYRAFRCATGRTPRDYRHAHTPRG